MTVNLDMFDMLMENTVARNKIAAWLPQYIYIVVEEGKEDFPLWLKMRLEDKLWPDEEKEEVVSKKVTSTLIMYLWDFVFLVYS